VVRFALIALVTLGTIPATAAAPGSASRVTTHVVPTNWHGACPHRFQFTATIVSRSPGTIYYHWEKSDGSSGPRQSTTFARAGMANTVKTAWSPSGAKGSTLNGWARVQVEDGGPRSQDASFVLQCK